MASLNGVHLRRRSSVTVSSSTSSTPSPWLAQGQYDVAKGEIRLPPSPPLFGWKEQSSNSLGLWSADEKKEKGYLLPYLPSYSQVRGGPIRRPWMFILIVCTGTLTVVAFLSIVSSSPYSTKALLSRIPFKMSPTECSPYSSFGTLTVDSLEADRNQWVPFDSHCRPPNFLAKLRHNPEPSDFSWLHNRTALIIGDSISREHVENFCQLMGEESEVVRKHHKYSVAAATRPAAKAAHTLDKPARLVSRGARVVKDASLPRICYIPKYDFLLASVFHFGLDQEDYWRESRMPQYASPGMFEHRLADVVQPLLNAFRQDGRLTAPDYVEVTSGMWDLARWAEQDMVEQKDTEAGLSSERVAWYRFRVGQVLESVRKTFPKAAAKSWRTMHYPLDQVAEKDYFMDKINPGSDSSSASPPAPLFAHNRIYQLDQAVRSLVISPDAPHSDYSINEWGTILKGRNAHQRDRLHGDPLPGGYVWGDIMLHELHQGVLKSNAHQMRA